MRRLPTRSCVDCARLALGAACADDRYRRLFACIRGREGPNVALGRKHTFQSVLQSRRPVVGKGGSARPPMTRVAKHAARLGRPTLLSRGIPWVAAKRRILSSSPSASARTTGFSTTVSTWLTSRAGHLCPERVMLIAALSSQVCTAGRVLPAAESEHTGVAGDEHALDRTQCALYRRTVEVLLFNRAGRATAREEVRRRHRRAPGLRGGCDTLRPRAWMVEVGMVFLR